MEEQTLTKNKDTGCGKEFHYGESDNLKSVCCGEVIREENETKLFLCENCRTKLTLYTEKEL